MHVVNNIIIFDQDGPDEQPFLDWRDAHRNDTEAAIANVPRPNFRNSYPVVLHSAPFDKLSRHDHYVNEKLYKVCGSDADVTLWVHQQGFTNVTRA